MAGLIALASLDLYLLISTEIQVTQDLMWKQKTKQNKTNKKITKDQNMWRITAKGTLNHLPLVSDLQTLEANQ